MAENLGDGGTRDFSEAQIAKYKERFSLHTLEVAGPKEWIQYDEDKKLMSPVLVMHNTTSTNHRRRRDERAGGLLCGCGGGRGRHEARLEAGVQAGEVAAEDHCAQGDKFAKMKCGQRGV